jgi:hypothetical protein
MDEKTLLKLWNEKRSSIISAQLAPTIMLTVIFTLAALGKFQGASHKVQYLTIGIAAATGILAIISQYAAIREAQSLVVDLKKMSGTSSLAKTVAKSGDLLVLSAVAVVGLGVGIFGLVVWAVLGK